MGAWICWRCSHIGWNMVSIIKKLNTLNHLHFQNAVFSFRFQKVHELDARYRFPVILWDLMPKAGASQIHPHFHVLISRFGHLGELGQWVAQVEKFHAPSFIPWSSCEKAGGSYFGSLARVHEILELVSYLPHPHSHSTFILPSLVSIIQYIHSSDLMLSILFLSLNVCRIWWCSKVELGSKPA